MLFASPAHQAFVADIGDAEAGPGRHTHHPVEHRLDQLHRGAQAGREGGPEDERQVNYDQFGAVVISQPDAPSCFSNAESL
jgi:hypothetical protein